MNVEKKEEKLFSLIDDFIKDMKKTTGANYDYSEIVYYIVEHFNISNVDEIFNCAKYLVLNCNYTKDEILAHEADSKINDYLNYQKAMQASIEDEEDLKKSPHQRGIHLEAKREKTPKERFKKRLMATVLVAEIGILAVFYAGRSNIDENIMSKEIGKFASNGKTTESIVEQATESLGYDVLSNQVMQDYREDVIANHIMDLLIKDPTVLDDVMHSVYNDLEQNRLYNMDTILARLRLLFSNDSAFQDLKNDIEGCSSFLDYIVKSGRVANVYDEKVALAIKHYNALDHLNDPSAFYSLSEDDQKVIEDFVEAYRNSRSQTYASSLRSIELANKEGERGL